MTGVPAAPRYIVDGGAEATSVLRRLTRAGWTTREGFALPAAIVLPPLVGLAGLVLIMAALIVVESTRYAEARRSLRDEFS